MNAGEIGDEVVRLVLEEINGQENETDRQIVFSRVLSALKSHPLWREPKQTAVKREPLTEAEAVKFENQRMPFGKYERTLVWAVPIDYLCRLSDPSEFIVNLQRYLVSDRGKRRIEEGM